MSFQNKNKKIEILLATIEIVGLKEELKNKKYVDHLLGCIYGNALGDAYGLATEFLGKEKIKSLYPKEDEFIDFPDYITNRHNSRWDKGDWTDDTDQGILILETFLKGNGEVDIKTLATKLRDWVQNGFPELGDQAGMGLGQTVGNVVYNENFLTNPTMVSKYVWLKCNKSMAANGSLMRTSIVSCMDFINEKKVLENTIDCCKLTHYDSRCIVSCIVFTKMISNVLKYYYDKNEDIENQNTTEINGDNKDIEENMEILNKILNDIDKDRVYEKIAKLHFDENKMVEPENKKEYLELFNQYMEHKSWETLNLEESSSIGYVYKCLGGAILSTRKYKEYFNISREGGNKASWDVQKPSYLFRKVMDDLIRQGGDADTNGAVAGALLGSIIGYSNLPKDMLLSLPNKSWLDSKVVEFIHLLDDRIKNGTTKEFSFNKDDMESLKLLNYFNETDTEPYIDYTKVVKPKVGQDEESNNDNNKSTCNIQ